MQVALRTPNHESTLTIPADAFLQRPHHGMYRLAFSVRGMQLTFVENLGQPFWSTASSSMQWTYSHEQTLATLPLEHFLVQAP